MNSYDIISVYHPKLSMVRVTINNKVIRPKHRPSGIYFRVAHMDKVEIFFEPWCIEPLIRFNQNLLNYGMANINQWDHKLDFVFHKDWADEYFDQIIQYKKLYIGGSGTQDLNSDAYIGVDSFHWDMVEEIEKKI